MNIKEIIKEIVQDRPNVIKKAQFLTKSLRRKAIKSKNKHANGIFQFESKNHNKYLVISDYFKKINYFSLCPYYVNEYGLNSFLTIFEDDEIVHVSPHFLRRYNERFLKQEELSKLEILKKFLLNNPVKVIIINDDQDAIIKFNDGLGLGNWEEINGQISKVIYMKTFIVDEMKHEGQKPIFDQLKECYSEAWEEIYQLTKGKISNGNNLGNEK